MNNQIKTQLLTLDRQLEALDTRLRGLSHQQLNAKPSPGAWSVMQVLQHLVLSERLSLQYLRKKTLDVKGVKKAGLAAAFRSLLLRAYVWNPIRFKAPAMVTGDQFKGDADYGKVMAEWKALRPEIAKFLEGMPDEWLRLELYKHPLVGRISMAGMLEFFGGHITRHSRQIERTLKAVQ